MLTKVGFMGTHCTRKTTNMLTKALKIKETIHSADVRVVQEGVRLCPFKFNKNATLQTQIWILTKQIQDELKYEALDKENKNIFLLTDRTIFDMLAYTKTQHIRDEKGNKFENSVENFIFSIARYNKIYFCGTKGIPVVGDSTRDTDEKWREEVHNEFVNIEKKILLERPDIEIERI